MFFTLSIHSSTSFSPAGARISPTMSFADGMQQIVRESDDRQASIVAGQIMDIVESVTQHPDFHDVSAGPS